MPRKRHKSLILALGFAAVAIAVACTQETEPESPTLGTPPATPAMQTGDFAVYLVAHDISSTDLANTDLNQVALQKEAVLRIQDIASYFEATHELELTDEAYVRVQQLFPKPVNVFGIPFVVCIGTQHIYAGAFWTPLSSISYDGIVIMQPFSEDRVIRISLGYPSPEVFTGRDPRADYRIPNALRAAGKLKWRS